MKRAFIALGSNIGDRANFLERAIELLRQHPNIEIVKRSSIYETEPVGYLEQPPFLNMVIEIETSLTPVELLETVQAIERVCGRVRERKWGPRTIDLDILLYDQENIQMENLIIPHPRMWERAFVIVPLMEIDDSIIRDDGTSIKDIYERLRREDKEGVKKYRAKKR